MIGISSCIKDTKKGRYNLLYLLKDGRTRFIKDSVTSYMSYETLFDFTSSRFLDNATSD